MNNRHDPYNPAQLKRKVQEAFDTTVEDHNLDETQAARLRALTANIFD